MKPTAALAILLVPFVAAPAAVRAQPEPSPTPTTWELSLQPSPLERITVDGPKGPRTFWYLLYTVTNTTGQDVDFNPEIVRVNEVDTELPADKVDSQPEKAPHLSVDPAIIGLDSRVFRAIQQRHARTHPFLVPPVKAIDRLLQGKDNARTSVAVFPDFDPRVSKFTLYFGGLSGERITRPNPAYDARKASDAGGGAPATPKFFVLQKTLALPYTLPGDVRTRRTATPVPGRMTWVMR
jgi:hypothetical protein